MPWQLLADAVVGIHFVFVLFVVAGGLLVLKWPRLAWAHLPCAAWGALIEFTGWICPLTPLEQWLRTRGGGAGYRGGFIEHYIMPVLYPSGLTREIQMVLGTIVIVLKVALYWVAWRRTRHRAPTGTPG